ncbi:glycosyltransferase [Cyclobacterium marinum]|uniref:glycosyltransferase n=1 Tax=Cyclobacterium marinum TaxID=104 RepID=UPI0011F01669|nr:glycosyltransferase [Cyclobacterium marinum]MBI0397196.1 glycosyltransferase [Cyclobacterium marinum]
MKNLLFVLSSLENSGGSERSLVYRVNYLVNYYNYNITVVTTDKDAVKSFYKLNDKINLVNIPVRIKYKSIFDLIKSFLYNNYEYESEIINHIDRYKYDVCTTFGSVNFLYNNGSKFSFIKIRESRFNYKRFFQYKKYDFIRFIWGFVRLINSIFLFRNMNYLVTLTEQDGEFWRRFHPEVIVMPNFINSKLISASNLDKKVVIAVGRLEKEKDFYSLIKAFSIVINFHNNWKLKIYGEGSLKSDLQSLIVELGLSNNVFLEGATYDIFHKYEQSSIYVHTSFFEGFGNSILEAMAHSLPIVAFNSVGGVKLLVKDELNGFTVDNRNIENLSVKIMELINNPELRIRMGKQSKIISENYSEDKIMLRWHEFYCSL